MTGVTARVIILLLCLLRAGRTYCAGLKCAVFALAVDCTDFLYRHSYCPDLYMADQIKAAS